MVIIDLFSMDISGNFATAVFYSLHSILFAVVSQRINLIHTINQVAYYHNFVPDSGYLLFGQKQITEAIIWQNMNRIQIAALKFEL